MASLRRYLPLLKDLLIMAAPVCVLVCIQISLGMITLMFAGKIDENTLAGVGLGNTFYNVIQYGALLGYSSIMDTYGPQVYGSSQKNHLSTVLLKVSLQGLLIWLVLLGPYLNLVYLMRLVSPNEVMPGLSLLQIDQDQDPFVSSQNLVIEQGVLFLRLTSMMGLLDILYDVISKYLTIQLKMRPVYYSAVLMVGVHILFNYLLTVWTPLGIHGLAISCILTRLTGLVFSLVYIACMRRELAWAGWSPVVWVNWSEMIKLGLSGSVNVSTEFGMYEISTFFSQFEGITVLNVIIIMFQITCLPFAISMGLAYASSVLIGKALAEHNKEDALKVCYLTVFSVIVVAVLSALLLFGLRGELSKLFTNDQSVLELFSSVMWLPAITSIFESIQTCLSRGVLTALGKQRFIAVALVVICYGVATPFIISSVFLTNWGARGILAGFLLFSLISCVVNAVKFSRINFQDEIQKVTERVESTAGKVVNCDSISGDVMISNAGVIDDVINSEEQEKGGEVVKETEKDTVELFPNIVEEGKGESLAFKKMSLFVGAALWTGILAGVSFLKG